MIEITEVVATKVRDTVAAGLVAGVGVQEPGKMCVEAAVCFALGLPHGDDPGCVSAALRALKMRLNDAAWSSTQARAEGLKRLALIQLGSAGALNDAEFQSRVADMTIRTIVPLALRAVAKRLPPQAGPLESAAQRCEREGTRHAASAAASAASAAYASASAASAAYAAGYAAASAASAAASAAVAAYAAAAASAAYAAAYAAADDAEADAGDRVLAEYAERVVQILIDMKAPGAQWLYLVDGL